MESVCRSIGAALEKAINIGAPPTHDVDALKKWLLSPPLVALGSCVPPHVTTLNTRNGPQLLLQLGLVPKLTTVLMRVASGCEAMLQPYSDKKASSPAASSSSPGVNLQPASADVMVALHVAFCAINCLGTGFIIASASSLRPPDDPSVKRLRAQLHHASVFTAFASAVRLRPAARQPAGKPGPSTVDFAASAVRRELIPNMCETYRLQLLSAAELVAHVCLSAYGSVGERAATFNALHASELIPAVCAALLDEPAALQKHGAGRKAQPGSSSSAPSVATTTPGSAATTPAAAAAGSFAAGEVNRAGTKSTTAASPTLPVAEVIQEEAVEDYLGALDLMLTVLAKLAMLGTGDDGGGGGSEVAGGESVPEALRLLADPAVVQLQCHVLERLLDTTELKLRRAYGQGAGSRSGAATGGGSGSGAGADQGSNPDQKAASKAAGRGSGRKKGGGGNGRKRGERRGPSESAGEAVEGRRRVSWMYLEETTDTPVRNANLLRAVDLYVLVLRAVVEPWHGCLSAGSHGHGATAAAAVARWIPPPKQMGRYAVRLSKVADCMSRGALGQAFVDADTDMTDSTFFLTLALGLNMRRVPTEEALACVPDFLEALSYGLAESVVVAARRSYQKPCSGVGEDAPALLPPGREAEARSSASARALVGGAAASHGLTLTGLLRWGEAQPTRDGMTLGLCSRMFKIHKHLSDESTGWAQLTPEVQARCVRRIARTGIMRALDQGVRICASRGTSSDLGQALTAMETASIHLLPHFLRRLLLPGAAPPMQGGKGESSSTAGASVGSTAAAAASAGIDAGGRASPADDSEDEAIAESAAAAEAAASSGPSASSDAGAAPQLGGTAEAAAAPAPAVAEVRREMGGIITAAKLAIRLEAQAGPANAPLAGRQWAYYEPESAHGALDALVEGLMLNMGLQRLIAELPRGSPSRGALLEVMYVGTRAGLPLCGRLLETATQQLLLPVRNPHAVVPIGASWEGAMQHGCHGMKAVMLLAVLLPPEHLAASQVVRPVAAFGRLLQALFSLPQERGSSRSMLDGLQTLSSLGTFGAVSWINAVAAVAAIAPLAPAVRAILSAAGEAPPGRSGGAAAVAGSDGQVAGPAIRLDVFLSRLGGEAKVMALKLLGALKAPTSVAGPGARVAGAAAAAAATAGGAGPSDDGDGDASVRRLQEWAAGFKAAIRYTEAKVYGFEPTVADGDEIGGLGLGQLRHVKLCCNPLCDTYGSGGCEWELKLSLCGRCKAVRYCSQACQVAHWQAGHRGECR